MPRNKWLSSMQYCEGCTWYVLQAVMESCKQTPCCIADSPYVHLLSVQTQVERRTGYFPWGNTFTRPTVCVYRFIWNCVYLTKYTDHWTTHIVSLYVHWGAKTVSVEWTPSTCKLLKQSKPWVFNAKTLENKQPYNVLFWKKKRCCILLAYVLLWSRQWRKPQAHWYQLQKSQTCNPVASSPVGTWSSLALLDRSTSGRYSRSLHRSEHPRHPSLRWWSKSWLWSCKTRGALKFDWEKTSSLKHVTDSSMLGICA